MPIKIIYICNLCEKQYENSDNVKKAESLSMGLSLSEVNKGSDQGSNININRNTIIVCIDCLDSIKGKNKGFLNIT